MDAEKINVMLRMLPDGVSRGTVPRQATRRASRASEPGLRAGGGAAAWRKPSRPR